MFADEIIMKRIALYILLVFVPLYLSGQKSYVVKSISSLSGVVYTGIDNPLDVGNNKFSLADIFIRTNNGIVYKVDTAFVIVPNHSGVAVLWLYDANRKEDSILIQQDTLVVSELTTPKLLINSVEVTETSPLSILFLNRMDSIDIVFTDDLPSLRKHYSIGSFTFGYVYGNYYLSYDNKGNHVSNETRNAIRRVKPGTEVVIRVNINTELFLQVRRPIYRFNVK